MSSVAAPGDTPKHRPVTTSPRPGAARPARQPKQRAATTAADSQHTDRSATPQNCLSVHAVLSDPEATTVACRQITALFGRQRNPTLPARLIQTATPAPAARPAIQTGWSVPVRIVVW